MSDVMRWRYGDTNPVVAAVDAATTIDIGDLVWLDTDDAKPASAMVASGVLATDQVALKAKFLGVAMQRSRQGDTAPIRVATTGIFAFDFASGTFELGNFLGAVLNAGGALDNAVLAKVTDAQHAIGRVARREPKSVTTVLVDLRSTVMTGGV